MKISELKNAPQWLKDAKVVDEDVEIIDDVVVWYGGVWQSGVWYGGEWQSGVWWSGVWKSGGWWSGEWRGGVWRSGVWRGGVWRGGVWKSGVWEGKEDRLLYMVSLCGVSFDEERDEFVGYRTTMRDGKGRWNGKFVQVEGEYYEEDVPKSGVGCCVRGIHVTSQARAWIYFGVDENCQMWEVRFKKSDLLDCDGEKVRIRGGSFKKIDKMF